MGSISLHDISNVDYADAVNIYPVLISTCNLSTNLVQLIPQHPLMCPALAEVMSSYFFATVFAERGIYRNNCELKLFFFRWIVLEINEFDRPLLPLKKGNVRSRSREEESEE